MRKIIVVAFVLAVLIAGIAWADVSITEENFPDDSFRNYVSEELDSDGDGVLSDEEIASVSSISVGSYGIDSLKGIEYFTALENLDCSGNYLSELDVPDSVTSGVFSSQTVREVRVTTISLDSAYPYILDMSSLTSSDFTRVNNIYASSSEGYIRTITGGV